jgi:hypothetical protein
MVDISKLKQTIVQVLPAVIKEVNSVRIPALEQAWGRPFKDEFANEDQTTVEIAKNYARVLNNCMFRHISNELPEFKEHTTNGSDYIYGDLLIEDKNSFSPDSNGWVGNGFGKTPVHLLKKFRCCESGRITEAFVALVDLSKCKSQWSDKSLNTNRSTISFSNEDEKHIDVIFGQLQLKTKNIKPITLKV